MRLKRVGLAVVVLGLIGLLTTPAGAQTRDDDEGKQKLERLWRLYPLDPEAEQEDRAPRSKNDTPAQAPPVSSDGEQPKERDAATIDQDEGGMSAIALLVALTLLSVGLLSIGLVARRSTWGASTESPGRRTERAAVGVQPRAERHLEGFRARSAMQQPEERSHVRVHLRDGRVVEGSVKRAATHDQPVLLLDIVHVADAAGQETDPEPLDAFLPLAEVGHMETIDEVNSSGSNSIEGRR
jgi:Family of unknown function (DUF6338)